MPEDTSVPGEETMSEKIARIKREQAASGTSDPAALEGAAGTVSSSSDPQGVANGQKDAAAQPVGESGGAAPGSDGSGAAKTKSGDAVASELGEPTAKVNDGTKEGERIRETPAGRLAESNDVILGDQGHRAPKPAAPEDLKTDGSKSPHDITSEGGSRQAAAHAQVGAGLDAEKKAQENPAFQAEAKARTI